ncbi:hypothetical protein IVB38_15635 [Bradyrhizobium sp. 38]|uniref:hypothetical protein n=1 Tax=unclassified Bradyrhizobium TaxID=2631580 RepID=UPI001FF99CBC|nr:MULTISPECIES: hypothetical protein [unclassified Bradyrhizobium]MCK1337422.1 hypothetical protein [Bradyrhizobium sp. 38]MCK1780291.1 hypothetical protein [Bradyrhizobium sp. 132]
MPRFFFDFNDEGVLVNDGDSEAFNKLDSCEQQLREGSEAASTQNDAVEGSLSFGLQYWL